MTTQSEDERVVRERWEHCEYHHSFPYHTVTIYFDSERTDNFHSGYCHSRQKAFVKARAFTEQRRKQIADVMEEIRVVQDDRAGEPEGTAYHDAYSRILAREQAALAELKKGWKEK